MRIADSITGAAFEAKVAGSALGYWGLRIRVEDLALCVSRAARL